MKSLRNVLAILLLTSFSSVYAGSCFDEHDRDVDDCQLKSKQGDASAQTKLGLMYANGTGVVQDDKEAVSWYKEAVKWWKKAAEQGFASAQHSLGVRYYHGEGVAQDYVMAHMFFNITAAGGLKLAKENRDIAAKNMTSSQIEKAQDLAREWMRTY